MSVPKKKCPNCEADIQAGVICDNCGLDVQTGESYELRVMKAKGGRDRQMPITSRIGFLILIAFGLVLLAGFMFQRQMLEVIREDPLQYRDYVEWLERIDNKLEESETLAEGSEARKELLERADNIAKTVLEQLKREKEAVEEDRSKDFLLGNFIAKIEQKEKQIDASLKNQ